MSSRVNFFGLPPVEGSSNASLDNLSISKSFSEITSDNLCGILSFFLKSIIH